MCSSRKLELAIAIVTASAGCNALLENEPGRLDERAAVGDGGVSDADPRDRDSVSRDDASTASQVSGEGVSEEDAGTPACSSGMKACGGLCVSASDPFFGCASKSCGRCELANATPACVNGACAPAACTPGFADCDAVPANGCEASLTSVASCGGCGRTCRTGAHAAAACTGGRCALACDVGFGDCNLKVEDGCEKNLLHDKHNCGACGAECVFGRCQGGLCVF